MKRRFRHLLLGAFFSLVLSSGCLAADNMSVAFLNPGGEGDAFFDMMAEFMQATADDLGVDLEVIYCDRDHIKMHDEGMKLLNRSRLPEYLILVNEKNAAAELLSMASNKGVKVALVNEGLQSRDKKRLGSPGQVLKNWVLEFLPDDFQAGRMLADALIAKARALGLKDRSGLVKVVGIAGTYQTGSSSNRVEGLRAAVRRNPDAMLLQVVPAYWEEAKAAEVASGLLGRYPGTNVIWAASDLMAKGAHAAFHEGDGDAENHITGGIDWAEFALHEVKDGRLAATVGGHFMDGGWALVMLYDLHHGNVLPSVRFSSDFSLITEENVNEYLRYFGDHDWSVIDFTRFSKHRNARLEAYRFGLKPVMNQLLDTQAKAGGLE